jgi:ribonuclease Z
MDLRVTFLGTAAAAPSQAQNVAATLVQRGPERLLVDCGEGTQRQLQWSYAGLAEIETILLTHNHADHYLGLPGLLKTYANHQRQKPLTVYGPAGTWMLLRTLSGVIGRLPFELEIVELEAGDEVKGTRDYTITALRVEHRLPALGYVLAEAARPGRFDVAEAKRRGAPDGPLMGELARGQDITVAGHVVAAAGLVGASQPGRKLVFSGDTQPCAAVLEAARGADLLVHEGTFLDEEEAEAKKSAHSTVREACELAREADVRLLALTHVSSRYRKQDVRKIAQSVFAATVVPADFDQIDVPYPERGQPLLRKQGGLDSDAVPPFRR